MLKPGCTSLEHASGLTVRKFIIFAAIAGSAAAGALTLWRQSGSRLDSGEPVRASDDPR